MKLDGGCYEVVTKCFKCGAKTNEISNPIPETIEEEQDLLEYFGTSDFEEIHLCHGCRIDFILDYVKRKRVLFKQERFTGENCSQCGWNRS